MRFNWKFLLLSALIAGLLSSCKYEEGPLLSLQSRTKRVAGNWSVAYATNDEGEETTDSYEDLTLSLREDYTARMEFSTSFGSVDLLGTWDFAQDETRFQLEDLDLPTGLVSFDEEFEIFRLTRDEFWLRDPVDTMQVFHLQAIETE